MVTTALRGYSHLDLLCSFVLFTANLVKQIEKRGTAVSIPWNRGEFDFFANAFTARDPPIWFSQESGPNIATTDHCKNSIRCKVLLDDHSLKTSVTAHCCTLIDLGGIWIIDLQAPGWTFSIFPSMINNQLISIGIF